MKQQFRNRRKEKILCSKAVSDILDYELVNEKEIFEILHKYRWVYKVIPYTPVDGPLGEFHRIYKELLKLSKYLLEKPNAKKAFEEYASIINKNDKAIIEWLLNHEQLGKFLTKLYIDTFIGKLEDSSDIGTLDRLKFEKLREDRYVMKISASFQTHIKNMVFCNHLY